MQATVNINDHSTLVNSRGQAVSAKTYNVSKYCSLKIVYGGSIWAGSGSRRLFFGLIKSNSTWLHGVTSQDYVVNTTLPNSNITYANRKTLSITLNASKSGSNNYYIAFQYLTNETASSLDVFQIYFTGCTYYS